jgi:integrase/recombinase XerD
LLGLSGQSTRHYFSGLLRQGIRPSIEETIMIKHFFPNPAVFERLRGGPLGDHIEAFAQALSDRGYAVWTAKYAMRLLAHLGTWLEQNGQSVMALDEPAIDAFFHHRYQRHRPHREDKGTLAFVLAYLRSQGVLTPIVERQEDDEASRIRAAFRQHLISQRNLAPTTIRTYLDTARRFVAWRFGTQSPQLGTLCAQDVNDFMLEQARRYSTGHTQLIASALRGFLRFLRQTGDNALDLWRYVPAPARRQLSGLPKYMPAEDVERLLQSIDRGCPQGRRDYAIVLLLARLGLRANEVATLRLEDVDWEAGELVIHGKGSRVERLPLPWDVGEALSHYLRDVRPPCSVRQVFLCLRAPRRGFCNGSAVGTIVRRALARADLHPPHQGAHLLRHSLATRLLRNGASLTEIGELLRHRNLDTTRIYAKVDERTLGRLAAPWPGGVQ